MFRSNLVSFQYQLGTTKLKERDDPTESFKMIFEQAIKSTDTFNKKINSLHSENQRLEAERKDALKVL